MRIAILGTGYVGLSTGVCLSEIGHKVVCIDTDEQKVNTLRKGVSPIYEPGLEQLLIKNATEGRLLFTTSHQEGLYEAEIIIVTVGTPQNEDGSANLSYIEQAIEDIAPFVMSDMIVVIKSTVPIGTNERIKNKMNELLKERDSIEVVSNPEFLRQGSAITDTMQADRIVIGSDNEEAALKIKEMYRALNVPCLITSTKSAEMIKYASNAFLATKISYINEIAHLCEVTGADVEEVARGMGTDTRIGEAFLQAGIGYGGSCFPKDVKALLHMALQHDQAFSLLKETIEINERQQKVLVTKLMKRFGGLKGRKIAMLGLAFKPNTDDMREAPSIKIAHSLTKLGAKVVAYDPVSANNAKKILGESIQFTGSALEAIYDAEAVLIVTEWNEFKQLNWQAAVEKMKKPIIFDGRNCLEEKQIRACRQIEYYPIGKPSIIIDSSI